MNRRKLIKNGLVAIGGIIIPHGMAEKVARIDPPKIYELKDLNFLLENGALTVSAKAVSLYTYLMDYDARIMDQSGNLHEKFRRIFCEEYNRAYFSIFYSPLAKSKVSNSVLELPIYDYTIEQMILIGDIIEDTIRNSSFAIVTPKISTILQLRKSFLSIGIHRAVLHHDIIGTVNNTVIYRDVTTETSDYVLTDSHLFSVDLKFPTVKVGDGI